MSEPPAIMSDDATDDAANDPGATVNLRAIPGARELARPLSEDVTVVDIWLLSPERLDTEQLAAGYPLLTPEERERHRKFVFERHRNEYLVTRVLARAALSRHRPRAREAWQFRRNEYGRPEIEPPCGLRFNLTNHPQLVACAVREGELELGCDLEPLARGGEVLGISESVFAPRELDELRALPEAQQPDRAISLWTLKEAYIKARSIGLSLPLKEFAFSFDEAAAPVELSRAGAASAAGSPRISFTAEIADQPARWRFAMLDLDGYRISLAIELGQTPAAAGLGNPGEPSNEIARPAPLRLRVWRMAGLDEHASVTSVAQLTLASNS